MLNTSPSPDTTPTTLAALQEATQGLLFPSESDYPILPFEWPFDAPPPTSATALLAAKGLAADTPVQTLDFTEFFAFRIQQREDQDEGQRETARRLGALVQVLQSRLNELRVYKVGSLNFEVLVLGHDSQGQWLGVSTQVVET